MPRTKQTKKQIEDGRFEISLSDLYQLFENKASEYEIELEEIREEHWLPAGDSQLWNLFNATRSVAKAFATYCYLERQKQEKMIDEQRTKKQRLQSTPKSRTKRSEASFDGQASQKVQATSRGRKRSVRSELSRRRE